MAVDNESEQWSKAVDKFVEANDRFKSLPKDRPDKKAAWEAVRQAMLALAEAGTPIGHRSRSSGQLEVSTLSRPRPEIDLITTPEFV
jgi:hypothetical protein